MPPTRDPVLPLYIGVREESNLIHPENAQPFTAADLSIHLRAAQDCVLESKV